MNIMDRVKVTTCGYVKGTQNVSQIKNININKK